MSESNPYNVGDLVRSDLTPGVLTIKEVDVTSDSEPWYKVEETNRVYPHSRLTLVVRKEPDAKLTQPEENRKI